MAEPAPEHEPKLAALAALQQERLSSAGRTRLLRHMERCEVCARALEGMRRFETAKQDLDALATSGTAPPLDWSRIEIEARRVGQAHARRRLWWRAAPVLLAAAAVSAAIVFLGFGQQPALEPVAKVALPEPAKSTAEASAIVVTALVGEVTAQLPGGRSEPLTLDSRPQPGWLLQTAAGAEAHLAIADTASVMLTASSQLKLARVERAATELSLERGEVVSKVQPLGDRRYEVLAQGYRVAVRGTHFGVLALEGEARVILREGRVAVLDASGALVREMIAPSQWSSRIGALSDGGIDALRMPRLVAPDVSWPVLRVPVLPAAKAWEIGGTTLPAAGEIALRLPPGVVDVAAQLDGDRWARAQVTLDAVGLRFDPAALPIEPVTEAKPPAPPGSIDVAAANDVLRGAQPELQRCYERSLRTTALAGALKLQLRLVIDAKGRVRGSQLSGADNLPAELDDCVREVARGLRFPPPQAGGAITFVAPLSFRTRR